ncbi:MAG TPA: hypothetical protein VEW03_03630 [Longimicrobiaceae bacterium]|nr:hypothetical protein [Longimicrobiaceae bacterium]
MQLNRSAWLAGLLAVAASVPADAQPTPSPRTVQVHTPARGSAERRVTLDALRADMRRYDPRPVIFVVRQLRVGGGWAWLEVEPQSPDGRQRYEPEAALLQRRSGRWRVAERMPAFGEREGTEVEDDCRWFARLRARFPAAPPAILPAVGRGRCPPPPPARRRR